MTRPLYLLIWSLSTSGECKRCDMLLDLPHEIMEIWMKDNRIICIQDGPALLLSEMQKDMSPHLPSPSLIRCLNLTDPNPILEPNSNPDMLETILAELETELETEPKEEEIDPLAMLAMPHRRGFRSTLEPIIEDPEAEAEAERAELEERKAELEVQAQAANAELAELNKKPEMEAQAISAELEKESIALEPKRRKNWVKRIFNKFKRGGREERENREEHFRVNRERISDFKDVLDDFQLAMCRFRFL